MSRRSRAIRESARGEECTLRLPGVCHSRSDTVVLAHSNRLADGKGMGHKAHDDLGAYVCANCHAVLDGQHKRPPWLTKRDVDAAFDIAVERTRARLRAKRLLKDVEAA